MSEYDDGFKAGYAKGLVDGGGGSPKGAQSAQFQGNALDNPAGAASKDDVRRFQGAVAGGPQATEQLQAMPGKTVQINGQQYGIPPLSPVPQGDFTIGIGPDGKKVLIPQFPDAKTPGDMNVYGKTKGPPVAPTPQQMDLARPQTDEQKKLYAAYLASFQKPQ